MIRRRRASSPASPAPAPPLEDDNLLGEILLRLSPQPSSLPRASVVCKRWCRLVSDPGFLRRFHAHHRKPPLLGFFSGSRDGRSFSFIPTLDPPDRIPTEHFPVPKSLDQSSYTLHGCRHGLALLLNISRPEAVVWDLLTGHHRAVAYPPLGLHEIRVRVAVVPCAAGDEHSYVHSDFHLKPFRLVLVGKASGNTSAFVCVYESESAVWGNFLTIATTCGINLLKPSILVGNALCWLLCDGDILEFDLETQRLAVIEKPTDAQGANITGYQILRTDDSGLGFAMLKGLNIKIWAREINSDGFARWVLQKTVRLDTLLPPGFSMDIKWTTILGHVEDRNAIILQITNCVFMLQPDSMQFKKLFESSFNIYHPYESFFAAGCRAINGG